MTADQPVRDYVRQSREFLSKARQYLAEEDLHQASEKGWGAASHMAKAVAESQGWSYRRHDEFGQVLRQAAAALGDERIFDPWRKSANDLHGFSYERKMFLFPEAIKSDLDDVELMLDALEPLTVATRLGSGLRPPLERRIGITGHSPRLTPPDGVNKMP